MNHLVKIFILLLTIFVLIMWVAGIAIAKGFWSTFFAIFFFPYSWYLVIEKILKFY